MTDSRDESEKVQDALRISRCAFQKKQRSIQRVAGTCQQDTGASMKGSHWPSLGKCEYYDK